MNSKEDLIKWIESKFDCKDGPHQAYVVHQGKHFHYQTIGLLAPNSIPDASVRLREALQRSFEMILDQFKELGRRPILYWRYAKQERILEDTDLASPQETHKIMTRIAVPGCDFTKIKALKPEGAEYSRILPCD